MLVEVLVPIISSVLYDGGPEVDGAVRLILEKKSINSELTVFNFKIQRKAIYSI